MIIARIVSLTIALIIYSTISFGATNDICLDLMKENATILENIYQSKTDLIEQTRPVKWLSRDYKKKQEQDLLRIELDYIKINSTITARKGNAVWTGDIVECAPIYYEEQRKLKEKLITTNKEIDSMKSSVEKFGYDSKNPMCSSRGNCVNVAQNYLTNNIAQNFDLNKFIQLSESIIQAFNSKTVEGSTTSKEGLMCKKTILNSYNTVLNFNENSTQYYKLVEGLTFMNDSLRVSTLKDIKKWQLLNQSLIKLIIKTKNGRISDDVSLLCSDFFSEIDTVLTNKTINYKENISEIEKIMNNSDKFKGSCGIEDCRGKIELKIMAITNQNNLEFLNNSTESLSNLNNIFGSLHKK